jgi:hypothetical protein
MNSKVNKNSNEIINLKEMKKVACLIIGLSLGVLSVSAQTTTYYVKQGAPNNNSGANGWQYATGDLQKVINACHQSGGGDIWVAEGTYCPAAMITNIPSSSDTTDRDKTFYIKGNNIRIYGGFPNVGTPSWADRKPSVYKSTLSGDIGIVGSDSDNVHHVVLLINVTDIVLDGFDIVAGNAISSNVNISILSRPIRRDYGGGIHANASTLTLNNIILKDNDASEGGGIYADNGSQLNLTNVLITANKGFGGGIYMEGCTTSYFTNVTISGNTSSASSVGLNVTNSSVLRIRSSIIKGNEVYIDAASTVVCSYSLVEGITATSSNHNLPSSTNPLFVDIVNGDYHLQFNSPCRDRGCCSSTGTDLDGNPRMYGRQEDMGCYEYVIQPNASGIMYVKKGGDGLKDGSSWQNALPEASDALYSAQYDTRINQIWVAMGTYAPAFAADGSSTDPRDRAFVFANNVAVYGGFPMWGNPTMNDRNSEMYPPILTGDLGNGLGNAYHVIISSSTIPVNNGVGLLDGCTITGGNADGSGSITVNGNTIFRNNGGGVYILSSLSLRYLTIRDNQANNDGGGIYNASAPDVSSLTIMDNHANAGGGVYNMNFSGEMRYISIINNQAAMGGGMYNSNSSPTLSNLRICGNIAQQIGGMPKGGAIYNKQSSPIFANALIVQNETQGGNGCIYNLESSPQLHNTTIAMSFPHGIGIYNADPISQPILCNSIVWSGTMLTYPEAVLSNGGNPVYDNCLIQGMPQNGSNMSGTIDPRFIHPVKKPDYFAYPGNYHLMPNSPCIDNGDMQCLGVSYPFDLDLNPRTIGTQPDLGSYEYRPIVPNGAGIVHVRKGGAGLKNGSSWANAAEEVADILYLTVINSILNPSAFIPIKEIWVAEGTYAPLYAADGLSPDIRDRSFVWIKDVKIYGGFPATGNPTMNNRDWVAYPTILTGDLGTGKNAYHVVISSGNAGNVYLNGFIIRDGQANGTGNQIVINGNPIYDNYGGGIYNTMSMSIYENLLIRDNHATLGGGGVYNNQNTNSAKWHDISIIGNNAGNGGGIYNELSSPIFTNLRLCGNVTEVQGSAMYNHQSFPILENALIAQNNSQVSEGSIFNHASSPQLYNTTISMSLPTGIGMINDPASNPVLCNSIIWSGILLTSPEAVISYGGANLVYNYCLIQGIPQNGTNLDGSIYPEFINPIGDVNYLGNPGDYHLMQSSQCIDYGGCVAPSFDLDGNPRVLNTIDLGAYEFDPANPNPINHPFHKNKGDAPIVQENRVSVSDMKLSVYPNPAANGQIVRVSLRTESSYYEQQVAVTLYSLEGKIIHSQSYPIGNSDLDIPKLSAGMYLIKVQTQAGKTYHAKVAITN